MRNRGKRKPSGLQYRRFAALLVLALLVPVSLNWLRQHGASLGETGEKLAVIAAATNMPEEGLDLLWERYEDELHFTEPGEPISSEQHAPPSAKEEEYSSSRAAEESATEQPEQDMPLQESQDSAAAIPKIPEKYRALIVSENFAAVNTSALIPFGAGYVKNETGLATEDVESILETPFDLGFTNTDEPQVLIVHTHATEAFEQYDGDYYDTRNTWRSRDNNLNMVSVGAAMAEVLEQNGIGVLHDTTQHDSPSYNGSYERSAATIQGYLEEYPSIKVVLDLHRDAMERENGTIVKPVAVIGGKKAAQIMIIAAGDDDGTIGVPQYRQNLRFAAAYQSYLSSAYPDLTRPVYFCYRKYNMDLTPGSLLLEFGSNANTLEEAVYSAQLAGQALADLILDYAEN